MGVDLRTALAIDRAAVPMVRVMQRAGVAIDVDYLRELSSMFRQRRDQIAGEIRGSVPAEALVRFVELKGESGRELNLNSPDDVATLLFGAMDVGRGKKLKMTGRGRPSTGKKQLELLRKEHTLIGKLLEYRQLEKLITTYSDKLPAIARWHERGECRRCGLRHNSGHWRVHTEFMLTRTDTGRLASKNPNLQNIPARTEEGAMIRAAFMADEGKVLVDADYSQIELRLLAHFSGDEVMRRAFREGKDIHTYTASLVFGVAEKDVDKQTMRLPVKSVNFLVVYGGQWFTLQATLALSELYWDRQRCEGFIGDWFGTYPRVRGYMDQVYDFARTHGFVYDPLAGRMWVPEVRSAVDRIVEQGLRRAGNFPIQGRSAAIMKLAKGELTERVAVTEAVPVLTVHDELVFETGEDGAGGVAATIKAGMEEVAVLEVPVVVDAKVMERWEK